jgi:hypothetical protein
MVTMSWDSAQDFQERCMLGRDQQHRLMDHFQAVGTSRPVDLTDPGDRAFALRVIDAWDAEVEELPEGIADLGHALRDED